MASTLLPSPPTARRTPRGRTVARLLLLVLLLALTLAGYETVRVLFGRNEHVVVPGRIYRCAQPSPADLEDAVRRLGIRTVVNLRGCCYPLPWYLAESRATQQLDVGQEDVCFSAGRLPSVTEIRRLVDVLERSEYPLLLHCRRGSDRTGMVACAALLLDGHTPPDAARWQLGIRFGHLALGRPANLQRFFDLYESWLADHGRTHSRDAFLQWARREYCPGPQRYEMRLLDAPELVRANRPRALTVRVKNTSVETWEFHPGSTSGIHLIYVLADPDMKSVDSGKAGLLRATVPPGESIELTVPLPSLERAGHYRLLLDMVEEQHCCFYQTGSEPLEWEFDVVAADPAE